MNACSIFRAPFPTCRRPNISRAYIKAHFLVWKWPCRY